MLVIGNKGSVLFKSVDRSHLVPTQVWVKGTAKKKGYWTTVFINPNEEGQTSVDKTGKKWKVVQGEKVRVYEEGKELRARKYIENKAKEGLEQAASVNDKTAMAHILETEKMRFGSNSESFKRLEKINQQLLRILDAGHVYRVGNEFIEVNGQVIDLNQAEKQSEVLEGGMPVVSEGYSDTELQDKYQKYRKSSGILISRALKTQFPEQNYLSEEMQKGLRDYQADGVNLALEQYASGQKGFICADGTGAGKTREQLALAYEKMKAGESVLICTEKIELAKQNFVKNDGKEMGIADKVIVLQNPQEYIEAHGGVLPKGFIYVTAYNKLKQFKDEGNQMYSFDQVIFDEAHNMKNVQGSQKAKLGTEMMDNAKNVALFTASPMDKPEHIAYIGSALGTKVDLKKILKDSNSTKQAAKFGKFFEELTSSGVMVKREVPLSNVEFLAHQVKLNPEEQKQFDKMYNEFLDDLLSLKTEGGVPGHVIMSATAQGLMKLRGYVEKQFKIKESVRLLEQEIKAGRQVVLFASRVNMGVGTGDEKKMVAGTLKEIEKELVAKGYDVGAMFGGKSKAQQMDDLDAFQRTTKEAKKTGKRKIDILIATEQSGSTGFNMDDNKGDKPRTLIDLTPSFSANISIQKYGRINRMSTKSKSRIIQMVTNTPIDSWLFTKSAEKMKLLGAVVQGEAQTLFAKTQQTVGDSFNLDLDLLNRLAVNSGIDEQSAKELAKKLTTKINTKNQRAR